MPKNWAVGRNGRGLSLALVLGGAVIVALILLLLIYDSKESAPAEARSVVPPVVEAVFAGEPVIIDGKLDDAVWKSARVYSLALGRDRSANGSSLQEGGRVRFAWNRDYLFVGVEFADSDVVAEGAEDQLAHFKLGDLVEVFLKPGERTWYWELYGTPRGRKTTYWFPGRGRLGLESNLAATSGLKVAAVVTGTLNDWSDRDTGWSAELAIPALDLRARGERFGPGSDWRVLIGRYNYSVHLPDVELSMFPQLERTSFHRHEEYARIIFLPDN